MGILGKLFSGGDTIKGALEGAGELAKDVRTAITGQSPEMLMKAQELEDRILTAQAEINKIEAASPSLFIAGARPFILWTCGIALFINYILRPIIIYISVAVGKTGTMIPEVDIDSLYPLMIALLGLGTMRTAEKFKGVQGKH